MEQTLYDRIALVCRSKGTTPSGLCVKLGIRKALLSDLHSGKTGSLRAETIVRFADALGVSVDYLLTGREFRLKEDESALLKAWRLATDEERQNVAFILREYGVPMPEKRPSFEEETA